MFKSRLMKNFNRRLLPRIPTRLRRSFLIRALLEQELGESQKLQETLTRSDVPLQVVIPLIERELPVFPYVIDGLKKNLYHPIHKITVLGPATPSIIKTCKTLGLEFVNEDEVMSLKKQDLLSDFGTRSGWWFQQFLKLSCFPQIDVEHYLILDADTVLLRPHLFIQNNKRVFNISDEFHKPYHDGHYYLFGNKTNFPFSFVSHMMCFDKTTMQDFHQKIAENHNGSLPEAILKMLGKNPTFSFSEFESFGQNYLSKSPENVILKYWFNCPSARSKLSESQHVKLQTRFRSVSYHNYLT